MNRVQDALMRTYKGAKSYLGYGEAPPPTSVEEAMRRAKRARSGVDTMQEVAMQGGPADLGTALGRVGLALYARHKDKDASKMEQQAEGERDKVFTALSEKMFPKKKASEDLPMFPDAAGISPDYGKRPGEIFGTLPRTPPADFAPARERRKLAATNAKNDRYRDLAQSVGQMTDPLQGLEFAQATQQSELPEPTSYELKVGGNGNYWRFNPASGEMEDTGNPAPPESVQGRGESSVVVSPGGALVDRNTGRPIYENPLAPAITDIGGVPVQVRKNSRGAPFVDTFTTPEEVGQNEGTRSALKKIAEAKADAQIELPTLISAADEIIATVTDLVNHPGFEDAYGINTYTPPVRGSPRAGAEAIRGRIDGKSFIAAINMAEKTLTPVSDADSENLRKSVNYLNDPSISSEDAMRYAMQMITYFERRKVEAAAKVQGQNPQDAMRGAVQDKAQQLPSFMRGAFGQPGSPQQAPAPPQIPQAPQARPQPMQARPAPAQPRAPQTPTPTAPITVDQALRMTRDEISRLSPAQKAQVLQLLEEDDE